MGSCAAFSGSAFPGGAGFLPPGVMAFAAFAGLTRAFAFAGFEAGALGAAFATGFGAAGLAAAGLAVMGFAGAGFGAAGRAAAVLSIFLLGAFFALRDVSRTPAMNLLAASFAASTLFWLSEIEFFFAFALGFAAADAVVRFAATGAAVRFLVSFGVMPNHLPIPPSTWTATAIVRRAAV